ncbi:hypothetical protein BU15DRAFT_67580 [Melanogaster broomeanus]|nr:hypothetical protein BU15DRAFT_67580 [Melanogaster broomeanus]
MAVRYHHDVLCFFVLGCSKRVKLSDVSLSLSGLQSLRPSPPKIASATETKYGSTKPGLDSVDTPQAATCHLYRPPQVHISIPEWVRKEETDEVVRRTVRHETKVKRNELEVQMLSRVLHQQVFKDAAFPAPNPAFVQLAWDHFKLQMHGLDPKQGSVLPDTGFTLPPLQDSNLDEHFHSLDIAKDLSSTALPPKPEHFDIHEHVDYPHPGGKAEEMLVFDVETMPPYHPYAITACAAAKNAWYSWISPWLLGETEETQHLIALGEPGTARVVVGHNVSYDRQRILEEATPPPWTKHRKAKAEQVEQRVLAAVEAVLEITRDAESQEENEVDARSDLTSANSLDVAKLYCNIDTDKEIRGDFMKASREDIRADIYDYLNYCAHDFYVTHQEDYLRNGERTYQELEVKVKYLCRSGRGDQGNDGGGFLEGEPLAGSARLDPKGGRKIVYVDGQVGFRANASNTIQSADLPSAGKKKSLTVLGTSHGARIIDLVRSYVNETQYEDDLWLRQLGWKQVALPLCTPNLPPYPGNRPPNPRDLLNAKSFAEMVLGPSKTQERPPTRNSRHHRRREGDDAKDALDMNAQCGYWISARDRILNQTVVWQNEKVDMQINHPSWSSSPPGSDPLALQQKWGMILPQVVTVGTVTRRAIEKTWLTASNAKKNRVRPAESDGTKAAGTDLHSKTASILGTSRDQATASNYSRIYGAGMEPYFYYCTLTAIKSSKLDQGNMARTNMTAQTTTGSPSPAAQLKAKNLRAIRAANNHAKPSAVRKRSARGCAMRANLEEEDPMNLYLVASPASPGSPLTTLPSLPITLPAEVDASQHFTRSNKPVLNAFPVLKSHIGMSSRSQVNGQRMLILHLFCKGMDTHGTTRLIHELLHPYFLDDTLIFEELEFEFGAAAKAPLRATQMATHGENRGDSFAGEDGPANNPQPVAFEVEKSGAAIAWRHYGALELRLAGKVSGILQRTPNEPSASLLFQAFIENLPLEDCMSFALQHSFRIGSHTDILLFSTTSLLFRLPSPLPLPRNLLPSSATSMSGGTRRVDFTAIFAPHMSGVWSSTAREYSREG